MLIWCECNKKCNKAIASCQHLLLLCFKYNTRLWLNKTLVLQDHFFLKNSNIMCKNKDSCFKHKRSIM